MCEERGCDGGPALCMSLNHGASRLWWSGLPPRAFPARTSLVIAHKFGMLHFHFYLSQSICLFFNFFFDPLVVQ